ncbi:MAG4270 family putative restriction endonuclease [Mycoplasmoides pirum]|uniref:MAG4270 family putative restriction endonuclease n=1 Tax=Mycoplasmoides pirum TaxID=2122 RepID=UPI000482041E|nr:hypothetical protein [Mycoplasmoides pirum]
MNILNSFYFKKVKIDLKSCRKNNNSTNCTLFLIIDEKNYIHDFKVKFKSLKVFNNTTKSHEKFQNKTLVKTRIEFINLLDIGEHKFSNGFNERNKPFFQIDNLILEKFNKKIWKWDWFKKVKTIRNIEYLITGSNPQGEDKIDSHAFFVYEKDDKKYKIGFLLRALLLSNNKESKKFLTKLNSYNPIWENENIEEIEFWDWINHKNSSFNKNENLAWYLNKFNNDSNEWQHYLNSLRSLIRDDHKEWTRFRKQVNSLRQKYKNNVNNEYKNNKHWSNDEFCLNFFCPGKKENNWEYAHIKPVKLIIKNYINSKKEPEDLEILEKEITDYKNFLPLPKHIHNFFDTRKIWWDDSTGLLDGLLEYNFLKLSDDLKYFKEIKKEYIETSKKYIKDYYEYIFSSDNLKK